MKKYHYAVIALCAVAIAVVLLVFLGRDAHDAAGADAAPRPALTVSVELPRADMLPVRLAANGDIAAWQEAVIGSDMPDLRLREVRVNVGDTVRAGEVLAVFDEDPVNVSVAQAEAALSEAEALAGEARENAERARSLEKTSALSRQAILQYQTAEQSAKARVQAAAARLAAERLRLTRTRVRAPDSGVISSRNATVGAVAGLGGELFRMVRQGRLEWRAELISSELGRVAVGTPVTLTLPDGQTVAGRVRALAPTVNAASRAGLVYVDLPDGGKGPARPGMFARGTFDLGERLALTVPLQAVVMREAFHYIFVLDENTRARQVKVTTGRRADDRVEIMEGLESAAQVIVTGAGFLNDGDMVRVESATSGHETS
ncbi:MAG: efflux RND transporter periplasmic adaptor subunit [Zoogloeaceae bacterium]|jgi:RND family efflux transporter MFP subunit|nr:efflux RND transporter periplasmic adaptor subunit [Zoogloeaceae bacterium]